VKRNIDNSGRILRGLGGTVLVVIAASVSERIPWLALIILFAGAFCIFEALRGWCALRACGIKTRM
jgi:hypothetical protein